MSCDPLVEVKVSINTEECVEILLSDSLQTKKTKGVYNHWSEAGHITNMKVILQ